MTTKLTQFNISTAALLAGLLSSAAQACWQEDEPTFWSHFLQLEGSGEIAKYLIQGQTPTNTLKKLMHYSHQQVLDNNDCQPYREKRQYFQGQIDVMLDFPRAFQLRIQQDNVSLAVVKARSLNIRDEPDRNAAQRGVLEQSQLVVVHEHFDNGWKHIQSGHQWGYISGKPDYLMLLSPYAQVVDPHQLGALGMPGTPDEPLEIVELCEQIEAHVSGTTNGINIRQQPNSKSAKLAAIPENGALCVQSKRKYGGGKWYKVLRGGETGYVYARYVQF